MCSYGNSVKELVWVLTDALDGVEGDFDTATLHAALVKVRTYRHVTDYRRPVRNPATSAQQRQSVHAVKPGTGKPYFGGTADMP
jgi:hypothetical protein